MANKAKITNDQVKPSSPQRFSKIACTASNQWLCLCLGKKIEIYLIRLALFHDFLCLVISFCTYEYICLNFYHLISISQYIILYYNKENFYFLYYLVFLCFFF